MNSLACYSSMAAKKKKELKWVKREFLCLCRRRPCRKEAKMSVNISGAEMLSLNLISVFYIISVKIELWLSLGIGTPISAWWLHASVRDTIIGQKKVLLGQKRELALCLRSGGIWNCGLKSTNHFIMEDETYCKSSTIPGNSLSSFFLSFKVCLWVLGSPFGRAMLWCRYFLLFFFLHHRFLPHLM